MNVAAERIRQQIAAILDAWGMDADLKMFRPEGAFQDDLDAVIDALHQTPRSDPALPVLVPGDPEAEARELRLREGIPIPPSLADKIRSVCARCGAAFVLEPMGVPARA